MKRKLKKFFAVFSVLICLVSVNLSLFTVGASANVVDAGEFSHRTIGTPVSMSFYTSVVDNQGIYTNYFGLINQPNVYYYDESLNTYKWSGAIQTNNGYTDKFYDFSYMQLDSGGANIFLDFYAPSSINTFSIDSPILFSGFQDLYSHFNLYLGLMDTTDALGNPIDSVFASYWYTFCVLELVEGEYQLNTYTVRGSVSITQEYGWFYVPLFNSKILTDNIIASYRSFSDSSDFSGEKFCYLQDAGFSILGSFSTHYFLQSVSSYANDELSSYKTFLNERFRSIYQVQSYEQTVVFEDISWTDWIVNSVGAFLDFEIIPGLTFAGMLGLLVGMSLFIVFLKIFAGG